MAVPARVTPTLPPLVDPAGELTLDDIARYSRHLILPDVGVDGQKRLKNARVLVIGAGGLGSPTLLYLAAAGIGTVGIVEFDDVELSNLQRQIIHAEADVGRPKAVSARESMLAINSSIDVVLHTERLDSDTALHLFADYDLIVDGTDNFATRYLVNDAASLTGKPYVWGSIYRFEGQVSVFWEDAPNGLGVTYRDLYPDPPPAGTVPSCAEGGVLGVLCASIGSIMVTEAVKLIVGIGQTLLGRLMIYDAMAMSYRTVTLRRDPARERITELVDYDALCGVEVIPNVEVITGDEFSCTATELQVRIEAGEPLYLLDVREPAEWAITHLPGAFLLPRGDIVSGRRLAELPRDVPIVAYCKTGIRSAEVLATLRNAGFVDASHLRGGIAAWSRDVDPSVPLY